LTPSAVFHFQKKLIPEVFTEQPKKIGFFGVFDPFLPLFEHFKKTTRPLFFGKNHRSNGIKKGSKKPIFQDF